jgi:hypothetical protein
MTALATNGKNAVHTAHKYFNLNCSPSRDHTPTPTVVVDECTMFDQRDWDRMLATAETIRSS